MKRTFAAALLVAVLGAPACGGGGGGNNGPNGPSPNPNPGPGGGTPQTLNGNVSSFGYNEHPITASQAGNLTATLTWSGANDLDLYLTASNCSDIYGSNACTRLVVSDLASGNTETITRSVQSGEQFKIWVDNFSANAQSYSLQVDVR